MPGFAPADKPRLAIAGDGTLAAIHEPTRITIVELPGGAPFAEVGVDPLAVESEIGWVGSPPRLIVLSRFAAHSALYLLDPHGPRSIAEIRLESPMRLYATVGPHALAVGGIGAAVLTATDSQLTPYQFPARSVPVAAGPAGSVFVVALAGSVEEWDPHSRMPKRRLRLPRPVPIIAVGGSDRVLWMIAQQDPSRIEVIPLVNRGQPKSHELPEPVAQVAGHPRSDFVACLGATTGELQVVDLDGRVRPRRIVADGIDRADAVALVVGRVTGLLVAQAGRPIAIIPLEDHKPEAAPPRRPSAPSAPPPLEEPSVVRSTLIDDPDDATRSGADLPPIDPLLDHLADEPPTSLMLRPSSPVLRAADLGPRSPWRDDVVSWARSVVAAAAGRDAPVVPAVELVVARFELAPELNRVLVLLYGAHLRGERGAAPVDIARVLQGRWDDALGRGQLAACRLASYTDSRVQLAPAVCRLLDELPARTGTMIGEPGPVSLLGPCVVVAPAGPLAPVAAHCAPSVGGAILAGDRDVDPAALFFEARVYGAAPMLRIAGQVDVSAEPAILVVADEAAAGRLGLPRLT